MSSAYRAGVKAREDQGRRPSRGSGRASGSGWWEFSPVPAGAGTYDPYACIRRGGWRKDSGAFGLNSTDLRTSLVAATCNVMEYLVVC